MPHKHTRRGQDEKTYELPPSQIAKPLPVTTVSKKNTANSKPDGENAKKTPKRKRNEVPKDDAPRAFKRLMALAGGKRLRSGLDDGGAATAKKRKKASTTEEEDDATKSDALEPAKDSTKRDLPTIRPGERMAEFAQRVDSELPLGGLVQKTSRNGNNGLKVWKTRKEMKMHKLYDEWRLQDTKIKERMEEERELAEERELEEGEAFGVSWKMDYQEAETGGRKKGKKGKKSKVLGEAAGKEEDPWAVLVKKRGEGKRSLHDVVKAPPELKVPTNKLVRGATVKTGSIPKAAGSLRQREELAEIRDDVVASYRKLVTARKAKPSGKQES